MSGFSHKMVKVLPEQVQAYNGKSAMRAAGARKIRKSVTRREKSGAGSGTRLLVHSSAMATSRYSRTIAAQWVGEWVCA